MTPTLWDLKRPTHIYATTAVFAEAMCFDEADMCIHREVFGLGFVGIQAQCGQPSASSLRNGMLDQSPAEPTSLILRFDANIFDEVCISFRPSNHVAAQLCI